MTDLPAPAPAIIAPAEAHETRLVTAAQRRAEKIAVRLLADPDVIVRISALRAELGTAASASTQVGAARLDHALRQWAVTLALREYADAPADPHFITTIENAAHGAGFPGSSVGGDSPDRIYRSAFLDGADRYEIRGRVTAPRPVLFNFELLHAVPGQAMPVARRAGSADIGHQISFLSDHDIRIDADGRFTITIGGVTEGPNHLRAEPGQLELMVRDVLSDWNERPIALEIRRIGASPGAPALAEAEIKRRLLADLPGFARFWFRMREAWIGGTAPGAVLGPLSRDGGGGYIAGVPFRLAPDQAMIVTLDPQGARYWSAQLADMWMIADDGRRRQTSLNPAQAAANRDGSYSYVIAARDPGVANWLDSAGWPDGYALFRWEVPTRAFDPARMVRAVRVVAIDDLAAALPDIPRLDPAARTAALARRLRDYDRRWE